MQHYYDLLFIYLIRRWSSPSYYLHQPDGEGIRPITNTNQTVKESVLLLTIHQPDGQGVWELLHRLPDGEGDTYLYDL